MQNNPPVSVSNDFIIQPKSLPSSTISSRKKNRESTTPGARSGEYRLYSELSFGQKLGNCEVHCREGRGDFRKRWSSARSASITSKVVLYRLRTKHRIYGETRGCIQTLEGWKNMTRSILVVSDYFCGLESFNVCISYFEHACDSIFKTVTHFF